MKPTAQQASTRVKPAVHDKPVHPFYFWLLRLARSILNFVYRPKVTGLENMPKEGAVLLLPNHISYGDAGLIQAASERHVRFVAFEPIYYNPWINWIMRLMRAIPIMPGKSDAGLKATMEALAAGHVVCIFPEGSISRKGELLKLRRGFERIAEATGVDVLPIRIDGLKVSGLPRKRGEVTVKFQRLLPASEATIANVAPLIAPAGARLPQLEEISPETKEPKPA